MNQLNSTNTKEDWRQTKTSLKSKLKYILQNEFLADVYALVGEEGGDQILFKCHSLILSMNSPIFERIYKENYDNDSENVSNSKHWHFPMFSPIAFQKFLLYIYTEEFKGTEEDVLDLIYIANDFQVTSLVTKCAELIQSIVNPDNCSLFYTKIYEFGIQELEMFLKAYILQNVEEVFKTESFTNLSNGSLESILKDPVIRNFNQVLIFRTLITWAQRECDRQGVGKTTLHLKEVLTNFMEYIDFTEFSTIEFTQYVLPLALLPESKSLQILSKIIEKNHSSDEISRRVTKSIQTSSPRVRFKLERFQTVIACPSSRYKEKPIIYAKEKLSFRCSTSIYLDGIGLYCSRRVQENSNDEDDKLVTIHLSVVRSSSNQNDIVIGNISRSCLPSNKANGITNCSFEQPILLSASKWYAIWAELCGANITCSVGQGTSELYEFKVNDKIYVFTFQTVNSKSEGQFPVLHFSI